MRNIILLYLTVLINQVYSQQIVSSESEILDTIHLQEINFIYDTRIDTSGLSIIYVLEKESVDLNPKSCGINDFVVFYNNFSAVYFSMGCVWDFEKLYWVEKDDSIFFFSREIENNVKLNEFYQKEILYNYITNKGKRKHIGSIAYGINCLFRNSQDYYVPFNNSCLVNSYRFIIKHDISESQRFYYNKSIKQNI